MVTMEKACSAVNALKPTLLMILSQVMLAGLNICYSLAAENGMDLRVVVAYRFCFGAAFIVPLAFFLESFPQLVSARTAVSFRKKRPKMMWTVIFYSFICALFGGSLGQNLLIESLALTSPTYTAAVFNLVPACTFVVSVCLRLEKLGWNTKAGKAKVLGTLLGVGGVMLFTFYKGPEIVPWKTNINLSKLVTRHSTRGTEGKSPALGIALAFLSCLCISLWFVFQAKPAAIYPCPQSFTALVLVMAAVQSVVVAACVQHDPKEWKLGWNIRLFAAAYTGIFAAGVTYTLIAIGVRMRGPLFASAFNPLLLILVAIFGSLFLDEKLCVGSLLGSIFIIVGLYIVLWGKSKEMKRQNQPAAENHIEDTANEASTGIIIESATENDGDSKNGVQGVPENHIENQVDANLIEISIDISTENGVNS